MTDYKWFTLKDMPGVPAGTEAIDFTAINGYWAFRTTNSIVHNYAECELEAYPDWFRKVPKGDWLDSKEYMDALLLWSNYKMNIVDLRSLIRRNVDKIRRES